MDTIGKSTPATWDEFLKGISNNSSAKISMCNYSNESSLSSAQTGDDFSQCILSNKRKDKCLPEIYPSKSVRVTRKDLKRPNLSKIKFKTHRPSGIKHIYDTDTELVLTLSIRHTRKLRPKLDKSCFEHPKRTVFYQPEINQLREDDKPHVNETVTSVKVQRKGLGVVVPVLIVTCIFVGGAFAILFSLLFGTRKF